MINIVKVAISGCLSLLFLGMSLAPICMAEDSLAVYAVDSNTHRQIQKNPNTALQVFAKEKPIKKRVDMGQKTWFYALYRCRENKNPGTLFTIKWFYQVPSKPYSNPVSLCLQQDGDGKGWHLLHFISSDPGMLRAILQMIGLSGSLSHDEWNRSRGYGPRKVQVISPQGKKLAQEQFAIYPAGVLVR